MHPTASFTATPDHGSAPLIVHLDASASTDDSTSAGTRGTSATATTGTGATIDHTFQQADPAGYKVTLTVTDDQNATGKASKTIPVAEPAQPPVAQDDALDAAPTGVVDVLGQRL